MESLLDDQSLDYRSLRRGDVVEGQVMGSDRDGVLVDVGSKSEGIIPPNEMHSLGADGPARLQPGDKVLVYVLQPESAEGQIILSLDRARGERGWRVLQQRFEEGDSFEAEVSGFNKGGLLVNVEGVNAFVPLSQLVGIRPERGEEDTEGSLAQAVGRNLRVKVIEINRRRNRVILSERAALQEWRSQQKDRLLSELKEGEIRRGKITSVRSFGVFIDLGGADGLAHLSELSWERNRSPEEIYHVGDEVDAYVMKVDPETKKIALSLRRAQPERWEGIVDRYQIGELVTGRVTKLVTFGAFARIDGPVEGLVHVSELVDRRINHPREVVTEGDILPLRIVRIERDRHRLGLSLRAARDEAERLGWEFNQDGSVSYVPEEIRREVEARTGGSSPSEAAGTENRQETEPGGFESPEIPSVLRNGSAEEGEQPEPAPANPGQSTEQ
jgi:small subunit ribosomal protein S1